LPPSPSCHDEKWGLSIDTLQFINAAQAAKQPIPRYIQLSYNELFKIQQVRNPYTLSPVSFSGLASYLECPSCALDQRRRRRAKEPLHFTKVRQSSLFSGHEPDARLLGTLLHSVVNLLHDPNGPLSRQQQELLLANSGQFTSFLRDGEALTALRDAGKVRLAMFFDELSYRKKWFVSHLLAPLLRYQRELVVTGNRVLAHAERFQFKLLSTNLTFAPHADWGGHVGIVGEFDQVRLRFTGNAAQGIPAIMEFKKGLGGKKSRASTLFPQTLFQEEPEIKENTELPSDKHAMQLMVYWLAFQTRWDILDHVNALKGRVQDVSMPIQQDLDLIVYNLDDGYQYQLLSTDLQESLTALIHCIFHLNWAMKNGYAGRSTAHDCRKTQLVEAPVVQIPVGYQSISSEECYLFAREAFERFKRTITWKIIPSVV
jgi:hypothetical protein